MNFKSYTVHEIDELSQTGIYAIVNKVSGRFYIGSASSDRDVNSKRGFYYRWSEHFRELSKGNHENAHLQNAWNKYGADAFRFQILEFVEPDKCIEVEQTYLDLFPKGDRDLVYNICFIAGSMRGFQHSEETKAKLAKPFRLVTPDGVLVEGHNLSRFCTLNNVAQPGLDNVMKGKAFHYKGWTASLIAHELYLEFFEERGMCFTNRRSLWCVCWYTGAHQNQKYFREKEKAKLFRDSLEEKGYEFKIKNRGWKEKLNAKEISETTQGNRA